VRLVHRYVLREFLLFFLLALVCATSILILRQIFLLTKLFVRKDIGLLYLFELVFYELPAVLSLTVPMAVLAGLLMALGQLAFNGEVTALRASGFGLHQLSVPVLAAGLAFALLDFWLLDAAVPWGNLRYLGLRVTIGRRNPAFVLEEGTVMRNMEDQERLWLYQSTDPRTGRLQDVRIWEGYRDGRPRLITAREASIGVRDGKAVLTLYDGTIYSPADRGPTQASVIRFGRQHIALNIGEELRREDYQYRSYRSMSSEGLRAELHRLRRELDEPHTDFTRRSIQGDIRSAGVELHKKYSIPMACLAFALVSVPLGVLTRRSGFMVGVAIGLPLIIVYYTVLRVGETLAVRGGLPVAWGPWLPNALVLALGVVLTARMTRQ
jgi:LPS export ABC transporter permease LptF